MKNPRQVIDILDQIIVLGARPGDPDGVALLEGVIADEMSRNLAGDAHKRDRIHERIGEAGDRIGGAGTRSDEHHAGLTGRARVALGGVGGTLLMAHQHVLDLLLLENLVIDRQYRAARIAEHHFDSLIGERSEHDLSTGHFFIRTLSHDTRPLRGFHSRQ